MLQSLGIEEKIAIFKLANTNDPRYLFVDKKTYEGLCRSFCPMIKNGKEQPKASKIAAIHMCGIRLSVLSVDTEDNLIEIA